MDKAAAHAALHDAIRAVIELDVEESDGTLLLTDWMVVYTCIRAEIDDSSVYGACYANGSIPSYRALGLLRLAEHQLITNGWES